MSEERPQMYVQRNDRPTRRNGGESRISRDPGDEYIANNRIELLPATAESFFEGQLQPFGWKGALEVILSGTRDSNSPLALLREHEATLVREIYSFIGSQWARHVKLTIPASLVGRRHGERIMRFQRGRRGRNNSSVVSKGYEEGFVSFARCGQVEFPEPDNRKVNMMPFVFGNEDSLPDYLQCYFPLIEQCPYMVDEIGNVGYLTVHETYVNVGDSQRREGIHIESPGVFNDDPNAAAFTPGVEHPWGMGLLYGPDIYEGGIFMASSVSNTSEIWDALVDKSIPGIVDRHGGCEHLRGLFGTGHKLEAGELIWMTDCTPHEALPQQKSGFRQFFRVVTPYISHWFADHSTVNPKVPLPSHVKVIHGSKFER